jgi:hypothetical protein
VADDFEVSIFLTDSPSRHSILKKTKTFSNPSRPKALRDWLEKEGSGPDPITIDDDVHIREESPEISTSLGDIPRLMDPGSDSHHDEVLNEGQATEDKKVAPRTLYDGFSIYGHVLCLVIKRKGQKSSISSSKAPSSQQMIENWVSTQVAAQADVHDETANAAD